MKNVTRILLCLIFVGCVVFVQAQNPVRILPLGDSNTRGTMSEPPGGYRLPLQLLLDSAGINYDFVGSQTTHSDAMKDPQHEGYGGWRIRQILDGREEKSLNLKSKGADWVMDEFKPDVILLMAGINDVFRGEKAEHIVADMRDLIVALYRKNPDVRILLGNLSPIYGSRVGSGGVKPDFIVQTNRYNQQIGELTAALTALKYQIRIVDMNSIVAERDLVDDVHPNAMAMSKMARAWFNGLVESGFMK